MERHTRPPKHECISPRRRGRSPGERHDSGAARDRLWAPYHPDDQSFACAGAVAGLPDEELVHLARSGCRQAMEMLLRKYRALVEGKARTFFLAGAERDDVIQEGMIGLYKAIRDFLPEKQVAFRSFAETCVTRQIITATKMASRKKHNLLSASVSLDATSDDGPGDSLEAPSAVSRSGSSPEQIVLGRHTAQLIDARMRTSLSELECQALSAYIAGRSYHEIAARLRLSPKQIDNALQRAKRKIKGRLGAAIRGHEPTRTPGGNAGGR
jgi:RNA polymerase sporulation-specific sigma factor